MTWQALADALEWNVSVAELELANNPLGDDGRLRGPLPKSLHYSEDMHVKRRDGVLSMSDTPLVGQAWRRCPAACRVTAT